MLGTGSREYEVLNRDTGEHIYTGNYTGFEVLERLTWKHVVFVDVQTGEVLW